MSPRLPAPRDAFAGRSAWPPPSACDHAGARRCVVAQRTCSEISPQLAVCAAASKWSCDVPVKLLPEKTFDQVPNPYLVLVPGGGLGTIRAMGNQAIREYLVAAAETAHTVASVCTGALILGAADLLQGRNATPHWAYATFLERLGARYLPQRWVQDGKFICSAGVSAGIDMALYLSAKLVDEQLARASQLVIEYDPQPPFGGIDWRQVDRDAQVPSITALIRSVLADHPNLVNRLTGPPSAPG